MVKKILSILLWLATAAGLVALFIAARESYLKTPVKSINLNIERDADSGFVKVNEVLAEVHNICGGAMIGTVNMDAVKKRLQANPWVAHSSAYVDLEGTLNIHLKEHYPALRVFDLDGRSVYVTKEGIVLPPSKGYTPHLLIANGNFHFGNEAGHQLCDTLEADRNIINAMQVNNAIERNTFMRSCIGQIHCNSHNEFEISARGLDAQIILGDTTQLDDKLRRLEAFMKQQITKEASRHWKTINLKYKNQIVCTKR